MGSERDNVQSNTDSDEGLDDEDASDSSGGDERSEVTRQCWGSEERHEGIFKQCRDDDDNGQDSCDTRRMGNTLSPQTRTS